ncbi:hypothetical protein JT229_07490 [Helicobacter pylori]|nr:hypothetical protein [Helicobacter pylori]
MRQENETAISFNELKGITQAIRAIKHRAQTNANANANEPTQEAGLKPKATTSAKKGGLSPTKKAFSERQNTAFRDNSQASEEKRLKAIQEQGNNANANAFKSDEAQEQGLKNTQQNKKGANDEA